MPPTDGIFKLKMHKNALVARVLQCLAKPPRWINGGAVQV